MEGEGGDRGRGEEETGEEEREEKKITKVITYIFVSATSSLKKHFQLLANEREGPRRTSGLSTEALVDNFRRDGSFVVSLIESRSACQEEGAREAGS